MEQMTKESVQRVDVSEICTQQKHEEDTLEIF